ncbi:MAG: helical backbone metal receptor [Acidimicrobiales bacterium]
MSLVPSITESLRAWGHDPIACTKYCEQPDLATVGGTKNPDLAAIEALSPDVVMLDREENRREDAEALADRGIEVFVTDVRRLDQVATELDRVATRIGLASQTSTWPDFSVSPDPGVDRRRVFVPIWRRPWMTIGAATYGSTVLTWLGFDNIYGAPGDGAYPEVALDDVAARQPDLVLVPSEPYGFEAHHLDELRALAPVVEVDGQDLFWWGTRTPTAVERLRAAIG